MNNNIIRQKDDLSTGMLVRFRNGEHCYVLIDVQVFSGRGYSFKSILKTIDLRSTYDLDYYDDDFNFRHPSTPGAVDQDIMKIWAPGETISVLNKDLIVEDEQLVWEREPDKKEMTIAEIEKALGYNIKIIK